MPDRVDTAGTSTASSRPTRPGVFAAAEGVAAAVELVDGGQLAAIVGRRAARRVRRGAATAQPRDRDWLERPRRAHDARPRRALGRAARAAPLSAPSTERGRRPRVADQRAAELTEALERLRGRVELGVKAFVVETGAGRADAAERARPGASICSGSRRRARARSATGRRCVACARCTSTSRPLADDARANPPQPPESERAR